LGSGDHQKEINMKEIGHKTSKMGMEFSSAN